MTKNLKGEAKIGLEPGVFRFGNNNFSCVGVGAEIYTF